MHDYTPNPILELQPFMERALIFEPCRDHFPKGVQVDVSDFHGTLDPYAFHPGKGLFRMFRPIF